jgi:hypothetical protein
MSQVQVVFLAPSSVRYPNSLETESRDLVATAGAVAKRVVGPAPQLRHADPAVNIIGRPGPDSGYWIRLPNAGGQWGLDYRVQLLLVDSAGSTPDEARRYQRQAVDRIRTALATMQRDADVAPVNRITIKLSPAAPAVWPVQGSRLRAGGMAAVLGVFGTGALVVLVETLVRRRATAIETSQLRIDGSTDGAATQ